MIKKLEAKEIIKIRSLPGTTFPCDSTQYIQYLMQQLGNDKFYMIGDILEDGNLKSYGIFIDNRYPPIFDTIVILDIWSLSHRDTIAIIDEGKEWVKKIGGKKITGVVPCDHKHDEKYLKSFNSNKIADVYSWEVN
jgi:hypothetical protein